MRAGTPGFIGLRLREARESRGLTITALGELLNISKQAVSKYESGDLTPSPHVAEAIAHFLRFPKSFFISQPVRSQLNPIFYRSLASTTKQARTRADWKHQWVKDIVSYLRNFYSFVPPQLKTLDASVDPLALSFDDIDRIAIETRKDFGIGLGVISNPLLLLENKGVIIARGMVDSFDLDASSEWSLDNETPYIFLSTDKSNPYRSRFDLCHELGHLVLHKHITQSRLNTPQLFKQIEAQAHRFSGAFLLPEESFTRDLTRLTIDAFLALKDKWKVSAKLMIKRCEGLGLLNEDQAKSLWIAYSKRGYSRNGEPGDIAAKPDEHRMLRKCFESLVQNGVQTPEDILANLHLPAESIIELAGLQPHFFSRSEDYLVQVPEFQSSFFSEEQNSNVIKFNRESKKGR